MIYYNIEAANSCLVACQLHNGGLCGQCGGSSRLLLTVAQWGLL